MTAEALAAACSDPDVLARLGGPLGDAARAKAAVLRALPVAARRLARAQVAAAACAVVPAGLRGVHPSWIEAALAELPPRARAELAGGTHDRIGVWLARWASSSLVALPPAELVRPRTLHDVARLGARELVAWLSDVGADQLAFALGPAAARLVGPALERIARCTIEMSPDAPLLIGARAIAPYTDALVRRQLALRLPRPRGRALWSELVQWAREPSEAAPAWDALAAEP